MASTRSQQNLAFKVRSLDTLNRLPLTSFLRNLSTQMDIVVDRYLVLQISRTKHHTYVALLTEQGPRPKPLWSFCRKNWHASKTNIPVLTSCTNRRFPEESALSAKLMLRNKLSMLKKNKSLMLKYEPSKPNGPGPI